MLPPAEDAPSPVNLNDMEAQMLKKFMITTAAAALMAGAAFAQTPMPPTPSPQAPAAKQSAAPAAGHQIITEQKADQLLFSKFKGTDVVGAANEKIGSISDVLFDKDGKVLAYVIGVGGFLGIGAKDVALNPASFQLQAATDRESMKLKLSMSKEELQQAAEFKPYREPARTTGIGPAPTTGMAPRDRAPATPPSQR